MNKVKIIVDSTCDLTPEYIKEHDIIILPLGVTFGEEQFRDGIDITTEELYARVAKDKKLPKTAAISIGAAMEFFEKYVNEGYDIFYTGISSKMSSSYNNAAVAAQEFEEGRVVVYDSANLSTGIGLQVLKAVKLRDEGKSATEIKEYLEAKIKNNVRAQFLIEQMDYLHKGGRCSSLVHFLANSFRIKPIIRVKDGSMGVYKKPIGKLLNACNTLIDILKNDLSNIDPDCVMITSSNAPIAEKYIYEKVSELVDPSKIMVTHAGCVISSHCGPGTIGILYIVKE